jgi:hypothetical protein
MSTLGPEVTAKRSFDFAAVDEDATAVAAHAAGKLICDMGHDAVDVCDFGFLKDFQYFCSAVIGAGPDANFSWRNGITSAAIVASMLLQAWIFRSCDSGGGCYNFFCQAGWLGTIGWNGAIIFRGSPRSPSTPTVVQVIITSR